ncbi:GNAT family N-acetyltransferase [Phaeobacter sp. HS012]|uniref:GNAT family N-acetyltransferase n=1 Tax=Phaeobacter TaxID=302485 RepID=UPI000C9D1312|nr:MULTISPECIES: GNAT family N-acetyltransferase [Phaeobacter]AUQ54775.1 putative acetyltransferase, GCN5-related protein [Phaeobacter inhibens]AUQ78791.1 putative acetyltransferase, GCN5-related protein [Phaeobacter inhibens]AUR15950.1 putative acetyltransferase, GCN5-related protein [Phaeobacter inhibens]MBQ4807127.1 GNAT family N-acetyltransferase [Phaeobacter sp. HS012]MBQ4882209.1 GNAT family N-acetyltransferase [Phaeobacter sp. HS011]
MTNGSLTIRPYDTEDNAVLTDIWYSASRVAHHFLGEGKLQEQRSLISKLYLPQAETWVACIDGAPVGFMGLMNNFVGGIFVSPEAQGKGVGQALIAYGLELKGGLNLDVYALNTRTCEFYKRLGFVETDRRSTDKEGLPFEEISMYLSN